MKMKVLVLLAIGGLAGCEARYKSTEGPVTETTLPDGSVRREAGPAHLNCRENRCFFKARVSRALNSQIEIRIGPEKHRKPGDLDALALGGRSGRAAR